MDNVHIGGTGFYFDKAPPLPYEIEHHMPYYNLYDDWIENEIIKGKQNAELNNKIFNENKFRKQFKGYTDYSIGFLTRGCFRKCQFCVNQKYDYAFCASPLEEFHDISRKKLCFLDDNFFSISSKIWKPIFEQVLETGKPFMFKQGLDERLLTDEICELLFNAKYDGDYIFAFDKIKDYNLVHRQLERIRKFTNKRNIKFYVLVGFESTDEYDIENAFKRIALLMKYQCLPYIMRFQNKNEKPYEKSKYRTMYINIARWCNQPGIFKQTSFRQYCELCQKRIKTNKTCSAMKALMEFEKEHPQIAKRYFDLSYADY